MRIPLFSWIFFIPICSIFLSFCIFVVSGQCLADQQSFLLQLKNNLTFDPALSKKLVHWNQSADCCSWGGIACSEGRVINLNLSSESITGGLDNSSSLFSLQYLQNLNLAYNKFNSSRIPFGFDKLTNLNYLNLSNAGFGGQIPMEISRLTRLVTLDLSIDSYLSTSALILENPKLATLVRNLSKLVELHLDGVNISAQGNEWCKALSSSLPKLKVLSMSNCYLSGPLDSSLLNLQSLSIIRLDNNNFSAPVPDFFANFTNLTSLRLSSSGLNGIFPEKIFQVPTLQTLDLSNNILHGYLPVFPENASLRTLVLSKTNFSGSLPGSIGNLKTLSRLDLFGCNFSGPIPSSMATQLVYLDMSFNNFTGTIPSFSMAKNLTEIYLSQNHLTGQINSTLWKELQHLVILDLGYNSLNGSIPASLFSLPALQKLQLSNNRFSGQLNEFNVSSFVLDTLDLSSNSLEGPIPLSIFDLRGLKQLSLSWNKFNDSFQLHEIHNLRNLSSLDLSYNSLSIEYQGNNSLLSSSPQITTLKLAYGNLTTFPDFLRNQSRLTSLDLSKNEIQGEIPNWIWKLQNLQYLNLSYNFLVTLERPILNLTSMMNVLDLSFNLLQGQPLIPPNATYLDFSGNNFDSSIPASIGDNLTLTYFFSLSSNNFRGSIPESICNASYLLVLDLSNNSLSGEIPPCLYEMNLGVLNLRRNNLTGTLADTFPGNCGLQTLDLGGNALEGMVPKSLANCSSLEVLNLGNNKIEDKFPCHLKNASMLRVLGLRHNKFYGPINCSRANITWPMLQIVDLASNNFSGKLPIKCIKQWGAMIADADKILSKLNHFRYDFLVLSRLYYQDAIAVTIKGREMVYEKTLTLIITIDVSCNNFMGSIPKEIGALNALVALNLSHNALSGQIPPSLGNLTELESLDLSRNNLNGPIPTQLARLTFLSFLNLSYNNLEGRIPTSTQLQSFSASFFEGNAGLCGAPLLTNCPGNNTPPAEVPKSSFRTEFDWQFIFTGVGFGIGAGVVVAPIMFWEKGRKWYDDSTDKVLMAILPMMGLAYTGWNSVVEAEEDTEDENTEESDVNEDETEDEEFRGRYCVFCSKLDISRKRVIHDSQCTCHNSPPISSSSSTSSSSS